MRFNLLIIAFMTVLTNCTQNGENPLLVKWDTPFETPPFELIKEGHYVPAFEAAIADQKANIEAIVSNTEEPTYSNTLNALDKSGLLLEKVVGVFYNLTSAHTSDTLQALAKVISPMVSSHSDDIRLNPQLFAKVKVVYEKRDSLGLSTEQMKYLEKTYNDFVRGGANLPTDKQARFRAINKELSLLTLLFGDNLLAEQNAFKLYITDTNNLAGLPQSVIDAAASQATAEGHRGEWLFTIERTSLYPFLTYAKNRELRKKLYTGYIMKGDNNNGNDNKELVKKIAALRLEKAKMLGFESHSAYILDEKMAKTAENVYELLNKVWTPAINAAKSEVAQIQAIIDSEGDSFKPEAWDWWYYAEKVRQQKYAISEEEIKPYFKLENVRDGIFILANKLWGITFEKRTDIQVYHPDVEVFEVKEQNGTHIGIFYTDFYVRSSKRGGAWMNSYRKQKYVDGKKVTPIITNVCNFPKPTNGKPVLLTVEQVETMFHEFGHALHGLLSDCETYSLAGTAVPRDFVELPSQIMENWATHPQMLAIYAKHYETGEPMPTQLIDKLTSASKFNQGFVTTEYIAASLLDMEWFTQTQEVTLSVNEFEKQVMAKYGMIPEITPRYRSTYFAHIFQWSYSSGYYSYLWAEVLDADAFNAFNEHGIFDKATAQSFRENILSKGGSDDVMKLYKQFRGAEPKIEPLLERKGF